MLAAGRLRPAIQECLALLQERPELVGLCAVPAALLFKAKQRTRDHAAFRRGPPWRPTSRASAPAGAGSYLGSRALTMARIMRL